MKWFQNANDKSPTSIITGKIVQVGQRFLKVESPIGEGGFANIYRVKDCSTGQLFALKHIILGCEKEKQSIKEEAKIMSKVKGHKNILNLIAVSFGNERGKDEAFMLLDLCTDNLYDFMKRNDFKLSNEKIFEIFYSICQAVKYLHDHKPCIVHMDIKIENVLLCTNQTWVLCDFGSATYKSRKCKNIKDVELEIEKIKKETTPAYRAPEMWDLMIGNYISSKVDIWALGCMLYILCFGYLPFSGNSYLEIINGKLDIPNYRPTLYNELIKAMIHKNQDKRPDIHWVLSKIEEAADFVEMFKLKMENLNDDESENSKLVIESKQNHYSMDSMIGHNSFPNLELKNLCNPKCFDKNCKDLNDNWADFTYCGDIDNQNMVTEESTSNLSLDKDQKMFFNDSITMLKNDISKLKDENINLSLKIEEIYLKMCDHQKSIDNLKKQSKEL